jgi:hypothetical protein
MAAAWASKLVEAGLRALSRTTLKILDALSRLNLQYEAEQLMSWNFAAGVPTDLACLEMLFERGIDPREPERVEAWLDLLAEHSDLDKIRGYLAILRSRWHASKGEQVDCWMSGDSAVWLRALCHHSLRCQQCQ